MSPDGGAGTSEDCVYKYGGHYRIAVGGELRKRFPKRTTRFQAPYRTLLTGEILDMVVLADLPPESSKVGQAREGNY